MNKPMGPGMARAEAPMPVTLVPKWSPQCRPVCAYESLG